MVEILDRPDVQEVELPPLMVEVTAVHILRGKRGAPHSCPIALAIMDLTGAHWFDVSVTPTYAWVNEVGYLLDAPGRYFVRAFDDAGPEAVHPMSFTFKVLNPDSEEYHI